MQSLMKTLTTASSGMQVQGERLRLVSENVANVDTPGYRRKLVTFHDVIDDRTEATTVKIDKVRLDPAELSQEYDPTHPLANEEGNVEMSNVNLLSEIADSREAQRSYEANMNIFDQTRRMYTGVLDLLKR